MKLHYLLSCDYSTLTNDGKAILVGIFDNLLVKEEPTEKKPLLHNQMSVVFEIVDAIPNEKRKISLQLIHHDSKKVILELKGEVEPAKDSTKLGGVYQLNTVALPYLGQYEFILAVDGTELGRRSIQVGLME